MFEFRGLIASAAKNENAGFATPQNKNLLSRKALFTDKSKPKTAFGDLKKNSLNVITPMKNGTVEKTKERQALFLPTTPSLLKSSTSAFKEPIKSTPEADRNTFDYTMDELDVWQQKQMLNEHQFDLIFMGPPEMVPPSPSPPPMPKSPEYYPDVFNFESIWNFEHKAANDEYDLPPLNTSVISDDDSVHQGDVFLTEEDKWFS